MPNYLTQIIIGILWGLIPIGVIILFCIFFKQIIDAIRQRKKDKEIEAEMLERRRL